jgi:hypothetical protein
VASTYRYLAVNGEDELVLGWFAQLPDPPTLVDADGPDVLHFATLGPLAHAADGAIDPAGSPLVTLFRPRRRRGLWTAGEVHFLTKRMPVTFPPLHLVNRAFGRWLKTYPTVWPGRSSGRGEWDYYLEGGIRNYDSRVVALPAAMAALRKGAYFVADGDSDALLETVCRRLAVRGSPCDSVSAVG